MTTNQFGILLALAAVSQFTVNSIVARFSDTHSINRKVLIISALMMGAISFSIYFYIHNIWLFIIVYAVFKGYSLQQCHNYMHLHVNPLTFHLQEIMLNCQYCFTFYVFFWFLIWSVNRAYLIQLMGYAGLFGGTVFILLFTLILQIFFYKDLNLSKEQVGGTANIEKTAPNMLKDKNTIYSIYSIYFITYRSMDVHNEYALFVTDYLKEQEGYVGTLASLCAGLEVPFMVILGMLSAKLATERC